MALSLQDGVQVWTKVKNALSAANANPGAQNAFRILREYIATQGGNPQLQFIPINGTLSSSDGGASANQVLADTACTLYGVYLKKVGTVETIFKASANATTAATDGTQKYAFSKAAAGDLAVVYPTGDAVASGLTVTENTARTTGTLTLVANRFDGFVVIGA
jgi:hypothetical protein